MFMRDTQVGLQPTVLLSSHTGNGKGYGQAPPECCHRMKDGNDESTAAAIDSQIH